MLCYTGVKQSGVPLGDVVLPTWAKGDAREFIRVHREVCVKSMIIIHIVIINMI